MRIKIIFDRESLNDNLFKGWGISILVEEIVLFDTGERGDYVLRNMESLKIDIKKIKKIVISHLHFGHYVGLKSLLEKNKSFTIYAPPDFKKKFKPSVPFKSVEGIEEIEKNIYVMGGFKIPYKKEEIYEQILIVNGKRGLTILCGCAHWGIVKIINEVEKFFSKKRIYSLIGGFHLIEEDRRLIKYIAEEIKKRKIKIGPLFCSGFEATDYFKKTLQRYFLDIKAGSELEV
jgi:7,8-dihydropterin-6-yl-methyl-4-(beta-D-ribofuranosyl)aminobenzene 5'-phosphate synthase